MQLHRGHELTVGVRWRRFQQMALADLFRAHDGGSKRLHLVAPPGAGKTLMGLEVALRAGRSIVPATIEAVEALATVGEITDALSEVVGRYGADRA